MSRNIAPAAPSSRCLPDSPKPVSPKPDSPKLGLGVGWCLPDSQKPDAPKPDSPKLGLGFRVRVRVGVSANRVSANRDWTILTGPKYRSCVLVKCVWCGAYYWFQLKKGNVTVFMHFRLAFCYSCCLFSVRYRCIWGPVRCFVTPVAQHTSTIISGSKNRDHQNLRNPVSVNQRNSPSCCSPTCCSGYLAVHLVKISLIQKAYISICISAD